MSATLAVTSASGQLGGAIIRALLGASDTVVGLARTPDHAKDLGVEIRPGDYGDVDALTASLAGVDAVLLVSGNAPPAERVPLHRNVLAAAKAAGVRKVVYTSIQGAEEGNGFSPVVQSNRQTEADVRESGMEWVIGRNGIYIEPDVEYIDQYKAAGEVANCGGDGRMGYTTRPELAYAYACLLRDDAHNGQVYNLHGGLMTQAEVAKRLGDAFGAELAFRDMSVEEYKADRTAELGEFIGGVIAGIYEALRGGAFDNESDYEAATGRPHQTWDDYFASISEG